MGGDVVVERAEGVDGDGHVESLDAVAPLLLGAKRLHQNVEPCRHDANDDRRDPIDNEDEEETAEGAQERQRPVVILETRPPGGSVDQGRQGGRDIHEQVAHQKENCDEGSDHFNLGDNDEQGRNQV